MLPYSTFIYVTLFIEVLYNSALHIYMCKIMCVHVCILMCVSAAPLVLFPDSTHPVRMESSGMIRTMLLGM